MTDLLAVLACVIAILAAVVAVGHWMTARAKATLDLFDFRLEVYAEAKRIVDRVMRVGNAEIGDIARLADPQDRSRFLFGEEVGEALQSLRKSMTDLNYCREIIDRQSGDADYNRAVELEAKALARIGQFQEEFGLLLAPYMLMDHKRPMHELQTRMAHLLAARTPPRKRINRGKQPSLAKA